MSIISSVDGYHLAWAVYLAAGLLASLVWWRATRRFRHQGWRDLLRGLAVVMIFTPWYASNTHEHFAPATMVVVMDLLLGDPANGLAGSLVLLAATAVMLLVLLVRRLISGWHIR